MAVTPFRRNKLPHLCRHDRAKPRNPDRGYMSVLNQREFTPATDVATGMPSKRQPSCYFKDKGALPQSADNTRCAFNTTAGTGEPSPSLPAVAFVDLA